MRNRITLFLMSFKGFYVLEKILTEFEPSVIDKIISSEDIKVEKDYYEEIKDLSESHNIKFYNRKESYEIETEFAFAISWRWIIKTQKQLIILHDSILPRYRGFSPLVTSIINKEKSIGVTAIFATEEYDTGDIVAQKEIEVTYPIKINYAIKLISPVYYDICKDIIIKVINDIPLAPVIQNDRNASYCLWRDEEDYWIKWDEDAELIKRKIDALGFPFSGACSWLEDRKVRIIEAEEYDDVTIENREPGKVIFIKQGNPVVVCVRGLLLLTKIIDEKTSESVLPLKKLRVRFK
jgi:methionyl-tRNA formyltransferase